MILVGTLISLSLIQQTLASERDNAAEKAIVVEKIQNLYPDFKQLQIEESEVKGIYQFWIGTRLHFALYKDDHLMLGELFDMNRLVSLSEEGKAVRVKQIIDAVGESKMIVYGPKNPKRVINVFTDIDCGFCRKLHTEVDALNKAGIQVRYLAFPRGYGSLGKNDVSYQKYVSVWCSDDRQAAMTASKAGKPIPKKVCETPIDQTYKLGIALGLRGTPFIIYDDGKIEERGYLPAKLIIKKLGLKG